MPDRPRKVRTVKEKLKEARGPALRTHERVPQGTTTISRRRVTRKVASKKAGPRRVKAR